MATAVGYVRVSTEQQASEGVSLDAQEEKIRVYASLYGLPLADVVRDEGESAKNLNRPGVQRVLDLVRRQEVGAVIVYRLDRLTRSVRDLGEILNGIQRAGVALHSVEERIDTDSATGRMLLNVLMSISQWEREVIGERTATALAHLRENGKVFNHVPYGFRREGDNLIPDEHEQVVIGKIRRLRGQGHSLRRIAAFLNAEGEPTKTGKMWTHVQVSNVLAVSA